MQEELKITPKARTTTDIQPIAPISKDSKVAVEAPQLIVTLERPESIAAREAAAGLKTLETQQTPERKDVPETTSAKGKSKSGGITVTATKPLLFDTEQRPGMMSSSLLPIATLGALLVAGMSFTSLKTTRSELAALTEAKASVDKSLAETQSKLSVAEKAIADIKAAIAAATTTAAAKTGAVTATGAPAASSTAATPAAGEAAKPIAATAPSDATPANEARETTPLSTTDKAPQATPSAEAQASSTADTVTITAPASEVPSVATENNGVAPVDGKQP